MAEKYMYLKMMKPWGGFNVGDIVRFGENKGRARIDKGEGVEVRKQKAVNDPEPQVDRKPHVETADAPPAAEKAVVTPVLSTKDKAVIDAQYQGEKAEADAKAKAAAAAKANAEAEAKAKAEAKVKADKKKK